MAPREDACKQVKCPNLKVCVVNFQRLPLCKCPGEFMCRRAKQKELCGSDGHTYQSRCHMRIASCNGGVPIWKEYRGACKPGTKVLDEETYRRKYKRLKRRRRRRRQRRRGEKATADGKDEEENQRRKKNRRRKRRKIGNRNKKSRSRMRRHRKSKTKSFEKVMWENNFGRGTWNA